MLDELRRGENVQNRRLGTRLTEAEYEGFESDWESQLQIREDLNDKPDELKRYEDKLKKAIFNYSSWKTNLHTVVLKSGCKVGIHFLRHD